MKYGILEREDSMIKMFMLGKHWHKKKLIKNLKCYIALFDIMCIPIHYWFSEVKVVFDYNSVINFEQHAK